MCGLRKRFPASTARYSLVRVALIIALFAGSSAFPEECPGLLGVNRIDTTGRIFGMTGSGDRVVLVDDQVGLTVWDYSGETPEKRGEWMPPDRAPWSSFYTAQWWLEEQFVLVATGDWVEVRAFDVRDPENPAPIWDSSTFSEAPSVPRSADYRDGTLAIGGISVVLYDLGNVTRPRATRTSIIGSVALSAGDLVALDAPFGGSGATVYRLTSGGEPQFLRSFQASSYAEPFLYSGDDLVVVGDNDWSTVDLGVVDLRDPLEPRFHDLSHVLYWRRIESMVFDGRIAFASVVTGSGGYFLVKLDFSDAAHPEVLAFTPGLGSLLLRDNGLLVGMQTTVSTLDLDLRESTVLETAGQVERVEFDGTLAVVADGPAGVIVMDASDPLDLRRLGSISVGAAVDDLEVRDGFAFLAASDGGMVVVDYSRPETPRVAARVEFDAAQEIVLHDGLALVATHLLGHRGSTLFDTLEIIDVDDPENPRRLGSIPGFQGTETACLAVTDDVVYLAGGGNILVIDLSDPSDPRETSILSLTDSDDYSIYDLVISDGFLYATGPGGFGLEVFDISDPTRPEWVTTLEGLRTWTLAAEGRTVYSMKGRMVSVIDFTVPDLPVVRSIDARRPAWSLTPHEGRLYIAAPPSIEVMTLGCEAPEARFDVEIGGRSVQFINTSTSWWEEILWDFGDGEQSEGERDPRHVYDTGGEFEVSLELSSPFGDSRFTRTVTIVDDPEKFGRPMAEAIR